MLQFPAVAYMLNQTELDIVILAHACTIGLRRNNGIKRRRALTMRVFRSNYSCLSHVEPQRHSRHNGLLSTWPESLHCCRGSFDFPAELSNALEPVKRVTTWNSNEHLVLCIHVMSGIIKSSQLTSSGASKGFVPRIWVTPCSPRMFFGWEMKSGLSEGMKDWSETCTHSNCSYLSKVIKIMLTMSM